MIVEKQKQKLTKKSQRKSRKANQVSPLTFGAHIAELRRRLFIVGIFFVAGSALAYTYRHELLAIILNPLKGQHLVYLTPGGGFSFIFQVTIYAGLILTAPVFIYQLLAFIRPALPQKARRSIVRTTLLATVLVASGVTYGYFVAIPSAIQFLSTFAEGVVIPNLTADSYLSFFLAYVAGLALLSLIPLLIMFTHWISPLTPTKIIKSEQWVVLIAFILAAIITPTPDVVNQTMIAAPVIAVYQIGAAAVLIDIIRTRRRGGKAALLQAHDAVVATLAQSPQVALSVTTNRTTAAVNVNAQSASGHASVHHRNIQDFGMVRHTSVQIPPSRSSWSLPQRPMQSLPKAGPLSINGIVHQ